MTDGELTRERRISTRRLEAFTDGVFAIAATLLVLDLSVEKLGKPVTDLGLWKALAEQQDSMISFVISFVLLAFLWSLHVWQFDYIRYVNQTLVTLNTLRLLAVVMIPFTTSLNSAFTGLLPGRILMPANFALAAIFSALQWFYATSPRVGLTEGLSPAVIRRSRQQSVAAVVLSLIVVAIAPFLGSWAFLVFVLNPLVDRILPGSTPSRRGRAVRGRGNRS